MSRKSLITSVSFTIFISILGVMLLLALVLHSLLTCVASLFSGF